MTAGQTEALNKIVELMREHFNAGIVIVEGELEENDKATDIESAWHGGYATSIGLLELGKLRVYKTNMDQQTPS